MAGADAKQCELVAKNRFGGFLYIGKGKFRAARHHLPVLDTELRASVLYPDGETTYTCSPPGSGLGMVNGHGDRKRYPTHFQEGSGNGKIS
jgi:hypothetical protein